MTVPKPLVHAGRPDLDFGPGFYVTGDRQQAIDWADIKASRRREKSATLNTYIFRMESFIADRLFRLKRFTGYGIEWLDFIAQSRKGERPWEDYDWIEGGIANDSVISTVDAYTDGMITAEQALGQLVNEKLKNQICISSQRIIDQYLLFAEAVNL